MLQQRRVTSQVKIVRTVEWSPSTSSSSMGLFIEILELSMFCLYEDFSGAYYTIVMGQTGLVMVGFLVSGLCVSHLWTVASNDAQYIIVTVISKVNQTC